MPLGNAWGECRCVVARGIPLTLLSEGSDRWQSAGYVPGLGLVGTGLPAEGCTALLPVVTKEFEDGIPDCQKSSNLTNIKQNVKQPTGFTVLLLSFLFCIVYFTGAAPKVMHPVLFCWSVMSEVDGGGMAVETEPSLLHPVTCHCRVGSLASDMEVQTTQRWIVGFLHAEKKPAPIDSH